MLVLKQGSFTCVTCLIWAKKLLKGQNCNIVVNFKEIEKLYEKGSIEKGQICWFQWARTVHVRQITREKNHMKWWSLAITNIYNLTRRHSVFIFW